MAIRGCRTKATTRFLAGERVKDFEGFAEAASKALTKLDNALRLSDLLNPPSNRFEALQGDRKGQYSIRINVQYRVCFVWISSSAEDGVDILESEGEPDEVEIADYH